MIQWIDCANTEMDTCVDMMNHELANPPTQSPKCPRYIFNVFERGIAYDYVEGTSQGFQCRELHNLKARFSREINRTVFGGG